MGKGGVNTMPQDGQHGRSILIRCKHCDKITTMEWEGTTADEFNVDPPPLHKIGEALNRLRKEFRYGEKRKSK